MLLELHIKNFALIDKLAVEFKEGFNVLTGETGAGKSIIVGALELLLGEKIKEDKIRQGSDSLSVEGIFDISRNKKIKALLKEKNIDLNEGQLILKRELYSSGRSKCYINNEFTTLGALEEIGRELIDVHGQHEHQSLLKSDAQREMLDRFADAENLCLKVTELYGKVESLKKQKEELLINEKEKAYKLDMLNFQKNEIEAAHLNEKEEEELAHERNLLLNSEKLFAEANTAYENIYGSDNNSSSSLSNLGNAVKSLTDLSGIDESKKILLEQCERAKAELEDVASELRAYKNKIEFDPKRLNEVEERLELISRLKKKYGSDILQIIRFKENIDKELQKITNNEEFTKQADEEINKSNKELIKYSNELSNKRKLAAEQLSKKVEKELKDLGFLKVQFKVNVRQTEKPAFYGIDEIEFLISPNVGETLKPLSKIASGGEISRIMLALKVILTGADEIPILIFDEIDAGIGGKIADIVGKKLKYLGDLHQVLCITHLAQIAGYADAHYYVYKKVVNNRTETFVETLSKEKIIDELARMIGGDKITQITKEHAKQLLKR